MDALDKLSTRAEELTRLAQEALEDLEFEACAPVLLPIAHVHDVASIPSSLFSRCINLVVMDQACALYFDSDGFAIGGPVPEVPSLEVSAEDLYNCRDFSLDDAWGFLRGDRCRVSRPLDIRTSDIKVFILQSEALFWGFEDGAPWW